MGEEVGGRERRVGMERYVEDRSVEKKGEVEEGVEERFGEKKVEEKEERFEEGCAKKRSRGLSRRRGDVGRFKKSEHEMVGIFEKTPTYFHPYQHHHHHNNTTINTITTTSSPYQHHHHHNNTINTITTTSSP